MQIHSSIPELAKHEKTRRRRGGAFTTVAAGLLCLGLAAPASAGGEFKDGFEDQLGRLLAVHAFQVGKVALLASTRCPATPSSMRAQRTPKTSSPITATRRR